ncbi:MAG: T9SS type A sorting domain-containing protein [Bacteroidetes bacterium]|nr:T9SS type A sorting domain-containing protein [Bacteroidota bacterium]
MSEPVAFRLYYPHRMIRIYLTISVFIFCFSTSVFAQIGLIPLRSNPVIQSYLENHPDYEWGKTNKLFKWGTDDTLQLPFFEDFTSTTIYPDSSKWRDNNVYVNRDFAINPPSYGVATFDFLDKTGYPYSPIEALEILGADTLTSQAINLRDSAGKTLSLADSVYFSFYYQCRGLGDIITSDDSLRVEFKDNQGSWNLMWSAGGKQDKNFHRVVVPINDSRYLHEDFQFRLLNITHAWGNDNHWHVDYILLNSGRRFSDSLHRDINIQSRPTSLLKHYSSMPYDHFMADPSEAADTTNFFVSNRNDAIINAEVKHIEKHNGNTLVDSDFKLNAGNVPSYGFTERQVGGYDFSGLPGFPVVIERQFLIRESGQNDPTIYANNNSLTEYQIFDRYYAYDDGTAESGFGFNDLKKGEGTILIAFDLKKADTLHGIYMNLTHIVKDVHRQRFDLLVYSDIALNGGEDKLLTSHTWVTDSLYTVTQQNGFRYLPLDSSIFLDKGTFYVGWKQDKEYLLGIGFDKNNGYLPGGNTTNKNIFFNIGSGWIQNSSAELSGAPMIRPLVGSSYPWNVGIKKIASPAPNVYPNPTNGLVNLPFGTKDVRVYNFSGQEVPVKFENETADLSNCAAGIYWLMLTDSENQTTTVKIIRTNESGN